LLDSLAQRIPPGDAEYLYHLLAGAFAAVALVAVLAMMMRRGPARGIESVLP